MSLSMPMKVRLSPLSERTEPVNRPCSKPCSASCNPPEDRCSSWVMRSAKNLPLDRLNSGISYVPEGRSNFPAMTVEENLQMGAYTRNDPKEISEDIDALCERFPILAEKRTTAAGNLSGGQQQMLEIAVALMLRPIVLLIDEPTLGLAPILVTEVFNKLQKI